MKAVAVILLLPFLAGCGTPTAPPNPREEVMVQAPVRADATWPWPNARKTTPHRGVTRWFSRSSDNTELELMQFDFKANPKLRFELYDQDQDDEHPFDNDSAYFERGVGAIVKHLNETNKGEVVAAWNGLFFSFGYSEPKRASHIGPVVIDGKAHYNVGNPRWFFGVSYRSGAPEFKVIHQPDIKQLRQGFDYGAIGAECLINEGKPLRLQPFPKPGDPPLKQPVPSTEQDVGHIPWVDFIRTSRTSMAWSKDNRYLCLLVVNAPERETVSAINLRHGLPPTGGWTVEDLQRFWLTFGAWGAINSDGGIVTQFTYELPNGTYELLPPRQVAPNRRLTFTKEFTGAPQGGTLMTFYVRDTSSTSAPK